MAGVTLDRITKKFGDTTAVASLSLEVESKEFVALLGPSGCGKTTTLNMMAGLEQPTSGSILFDGEAVEHLPPERRDIAMVFQSVALYPHLSVYDNIAFPLRMMRRPKAEIDRRVRQAAELMHITDLYDRKPHQLSGGQRQRAALGRAVVRDPAVFLFDEPLSALDAKLRVDMRVEIKKLHERLGATFVYVTHDQVEALTMADRIAVMDKGELHQYGTPDQIYGRPENMTVARFVGSPSMNFLRGSVSKSGDDWRFKSGVVSLPLTGAVREAVRTANLGEVILGIRPEQAVVDGAADNAVNGFVYATEPVGSDLFLDITFEAPDAHNPQLFKVRTRPDVRVRTGEQVPVGFPKEHIYLFEPLGRCIHPRETRP